MARKAKKASKFKVGDRVVYNAVISGNGWLNGMIGRVIYVDSTRCPYTVEFDEPLSGGVTDYRARENGINPKPFHGWFCREDNLTKHKEERS